jgi:hypothetical protein
MLVILPANSSLIAGFLLNAIKPVSKLSGNLMELREVHTQTQKGVGA